MNGNLRHIILLPLALLMAMGIASCGDKSQPDDSSIERDEWKAYQAPAPESFKAILGPVSDEVNSLPTYIERRPLKQIFNDSNELQLKGAQRWGIAPLSHDLASAWHLKKPIVKIETCRAYVVDSLTMSMPFLVPHAAKLLEEIGLAFSDTVRARGGHEYRIKVTSLTRSDYTVSRLKRRNRAATTESCHRYGTTFDISWTRFECLDSTHVVSLEDLKNILAEVIQERRQKGKCYAIFERKQGCFHVTTR